MPNWRVGWLPQQPQQQHQPQRHHHHSRQPSQNEFNRGDLSVQWGLHWRPGSGQCPPVWRVLAAGVGWRPCCSVFFACSRGVFASRKAKLHHRMNWAGVSSQTSEGRGGALFISANAQYKYLSLCVPFRAVFLCDAGPPFVLCSADLHFATKGIQVSRLSTTLAATPSHGTSPL